MESHPRCRNCHSAAEPTAIYKTATWPECYVRLCAVCLDRWMEHGWIERRAS